MSDLHETDILIRIKEAYHNGLAWVALTVSNINSVGVTNSGRRSELHRTSDTNQLFFHDGTIIQPVQTLDMAVTDRTDGYIITDRTTGGLIYDY